MYFKGGKIASLKTDHISVKWQGKLISVEKWSAHTSWDLKRNCSLKDQDEEH